MCMWFGFNPAINFCHFSTLLTLSVCVGATSTSPKFYLFSSKVCRVYRKFHLQCMLKEQSAQVYNICNSACAHCTHNSGSKIHFSNLTVITAIIWATLWENQQNDVRPAKTQISLCIRLVWSESLLSAWRKLGSLATHWVHYEDSDQTGWMPRLIWVVAGCKVILLSHLL